jgi:hypothetical protein
MVLTVRFLCSLKNYYPMICTDVKVIFNRFVQVLVISLQPPRFSLLSRGQDIRIQSA